MKTLRRSIGRPEVGGEPLPPAFQVFQLHGIVLRRAEVSVIAGTPGAGKSTLALHIAARLKQPTLYFSARYKCTHNGYEINILNGRCYSSRSRAYATTRQETRQKDISNKLIICSGLLSQPLLSKI